MAIKAGGHEHIGVTLELVGQPPVASGLRLRLLQELISPMTAVLALENGLSCSAAFAGRRRGRGVR